MRGLLHGTIFSYKTVGLYIPETRWYFGNIDYKPAMSECGLENSQSYDCRSIVCISGNRMILKPDKKDLRLGGYMFFTYIRKLCYDDNYIKPIAMAITSNTFKIPLSIII